MSSLAARHCRAVSFPHVFLCASHMAHVIRDEIPPDIRATPRRKFCEDHDIALLKEVVAYDAHVCRRGSQMDKFDEVSLAANESNMMPWETEGKQWLDRYKLLVASFKRADRIRASALGTEEDFGEKDQLLSDIFCAVHDTNERGLKELLESARRDKELLKAGETIRFQAMNRRTVDRQTGHDVIVPVASSEIEEDGLVSLDDGAAHNSSSTRRLRNIEIDELSTEVALRRSKRRGPMTWKTFCSLLRKEGRTKIRSALSWRHIVWISIASVQRHIMQRKTNGLSFFRVRMSCSASNSATIL
jgi:hypothetical protein